MAFKKWVRNTLGLEEKETFNNNVEESEKQFGVVKGLIQAVNQRINNIVLKSGGTSPNEVVDARTGYNGEQHPILKERLDDEYQKQENRISATENGISDLQDEQQEMEMKLNKLYGGTGESVSIFVSSSVGNDTSGDGSVQKPYKTIQRAANDIPLTSTSEFHIEIEPGAYYEDVRITNRTCPRIIVRGTNHTTVNSHNADTGVFVRSIYISDCSGYCSTIGLTQIDAINTGLTSSTGTRVGLMFTRCGYAVVNNCRNMQDTKNLGYAAIYYDACTGRIYDSKFSNQGTVLFANFMSHLEYENTNVGEANNEVIRCHRSIIHAAGLVTAGVTKIIKSAAGQVFE